MKNLFVLLAAMFAVCVFAGDSQAFGGRRGCNGGGRVFFNPCVNTCQSACNSCNTCGFHPVQTVWNGVVRILPPYGNNCNGNVCTPPSAPSSGAPSATPASPALPRTGPATLPKKES